LPDTSPAAPEPLRPFDRLPSHIQLRRSLNRRQFLLAAGVGLGGAACTRVGTGGLTPASPGSIDALTAGTTMVSVIGTGGDAPQMNPGKNRLGFILPTVDGNGVAGGSPQVWLAKDSTSKATGPVPATWHPFTGYDQTGDHSPRSPLPGSFSVELDIPSPGTWVVAAVLAAGSQRLAGTGLLLVSGGSISGTVGSQAISTPTPVATTTAAIEEICTRTPVDGPSRCVLCGRSWSHARSCRPPQRPSLGALRLAHALVDDLEQPGERSVQLVL